MGREFLRQQWGIFKQTLKDIVSQNKKRRDNGAFMVAVKAVTSGVSEEKVLVMLSITKIIYDILKYIINL